MAKVAPGHAYNISNLNILFAFSSIALFGATLWMVWADYSREWKGYQREFVEMERQGASQQLQEAQAGINQNEFQRIEQELAAAEQELTSREAELNELQAQRDELESRRTLADIAERELKAIYDSKKFFFEEGDHAPLGKRVSAEEFSALESDFFAARDLRVSLDLDISNVDSQSRTLQSKVSELTTARAELNQSATLIQRKIDSIADNFPNTFRNLPVVDFIDPSIEIKQVLVRNVTDDLNFIQVPRIDRCMTCHLGIDNPDYADAPQPYTTHPNLELYVDRESAHSIDEFGCTSCHEGRGRSTEFVGVTHTPRDEEQKLDWEARHDWVEDHYWDKPMYPVGLTEAGCLKCHSDQVLVPQGEQVNKSRMLYEAAGCWGCHNTEGFEGRRNTGPKLEHIVSKTTKDWALRWVKDPKSFKTSNYMPRFWDLENNLNSEIGDRNNTEIDAIVTYVFDKSKPLSYTSVPSGDVSQGQANFDELGCKGCHVVDESDLENVSWYRQRGASLYGVGSKVNEQFLFDWLKNPKHYWEETYMPDLRLSDREAADITAYLMTLKNPDFEAIPVPTPNSESLDEITLEFLKATLPDAPARAQLESMSSEEKTLYSGERLILRYGCFGCHEIEGFENAQKIGVDLSTWGSKMVTRLDFGTIDIDHNRETWLRQKLNHPRSYDRGKVRSPGEKLRMGYFGFTENEVDDIVRNVLGQVRSDLPQEGVKTLAGSEAYAEEAREIIHLQNCRGCHLVDGTGGGIYETIEDPGLRPPDLNTQGARTQADWLFHFLNEPSTVRSWLNVRMPTFAFSEEEANTLVQGFMAMEGTQPFDTDAAGVHSPETLRVGAQLLTQLQCERCHLAEAVGALDASQLAPSFRLTGERLREPWLVDWMKDPQTITPGTLMPQFWPRDDAGNFMTALPDVLGGDAEAQMEAVAAFLMRYNR